VIGIPVIGFLLLLGIIAWSLTGSLPALSGNLAARMLTEKSLPRIIIPWSDTGLSQADRQTLQAVLAENAETLTSELVTCRLIGTDDGIAVQWTASASAAWCVVDAVSDSAGTNCSRQPGRMSPSMPGKFATLWHSTPQPTRWVLPSLPKLTNASSAPQWKMNAASFTSAYRATRSL